MSRGQAPITMAREKEIIEILKAENPRSVRFVFYKMTDPRLDCCVDKTESGYQLIKRIMISMRKKDLLSYDWVSDSTREGELQYCYRSPESCLNNAVYYYREPLWKNHYVVVWTESRSIASIIKPICDEYRVDLYAAGGFSSLSLIKDSADRMDTESGGINPVTVLFLGDYDPAGVIIDKSIEAGLKGHLPWLDINFNRIGINKEHIREYGLPTKPRKDKEKRSPEMEVAVEAESMDGDDLRGLLSDELEKLMPGDLMRETLDREIAMKKTMRDFISQNTFSQP